MLENVTIIVFTRNRPDKASAVIRMWLRHGARVLLLDASTQPDLVNEFKTKSNLLYFWANSFWERALFASNSIETKYALIHSDDSLVFPSVVSQGISILDTEDQYGFLYAPGNFSSTWYEDSSWEFSKEWSGESSYERMLYWAKRPNDLMWGALWRKRDLEKALWIWGKSTSVFPFETNLHTTSLYLAGAALTSGRLMSGPLHFSRHWIAPKDETFQTVRLINDPIGIDTNHPENRKLYDSWKYSFIECVNKHLDTEQHISLEQLNFLLEQYRRNDPNKGLLLSGRIGIRQRVREKLLIELTHYGRNQGKYASIASIILILLKHFKLLTNYLKKRRCGWYRSKLLRDFTEHELVQFGIKKEKYSELSLKNFKKLFVE